MVCAGLIFGVDLLSMQDAGKTTIVVAFGKLKNECDLKTVWKSVRNKNAIILKTKAYNFHRARPVHTLCPGTLSRRQSARKKALKAKHRP